MNGAILDGCLVSQVIHGFDGDIHPLHGEEGCQIGCVGGDDDQGECPPRESRSKDGEVRFPMDWIPIPTLHLLLSTADPHREAFLNRRADLTTLH